MKFEDLTPEQKAKVEGCKSPEEVFALAKAEGYELSADELDAITGGMVDTSAPTGGVGKGW
ncbi:MAG: Nif11-like leader peptide family natural product precursor [Coriobacteriales bacterium]|nr:Nif11-like leader peptide family natural product precursor [Coriobacteriales bacterium]